MYRRVDLVSNAGQQAIAVAFRFLLMDLGRYYRGAAGNTQAWHSKLRFPTISCFASLNNALPPAWYIKYTVINCRVLSS
jgi:hypothetical protein